MHHAAINAELARLRHAQAIDAAGAHGVDGTPEETTRNPTMLDALFSLAAKLLPELHAPVPHAPRAAGSA